MAGATPSIWSMTTSAGLGRLITIEDNDGYTRMFDYDKMGNVTDYENGEGVAKVYVLLKDQYNMMSVSNVEMSIAVWNNTVM